MFECFGAGTISWHDHHLRADSDVGKGAHFGRWDFWVAKGLGGYPSLARCPGGREDQPGTHYYKSQGDRARGFVGKEKSFQVDFLMEVKMWIAEDDLSCFS